MIKNEKLIARKVVDCCHNNCFCFYEFLIWDVADNSELFNFYIQKMSNEGIEAREIYTYNTLYSDDWKVVIASIMEKYFAHIMPSLSFSLFYFELENLRRNSIISKNLK